MKKPRRKPGLFCLKAVGYGRAVKSSTDWETRTLIRPSIVQGIKSRSANPARYQKTPQLLPRQTGGTCGVFVRCCSQSVHTFLKKCFVLELTAGTQYGSRYSLPYNLAPHQHEIHIYSCCQDYYNHRRVLHALTRQ